MLTQLRRGGGDLSENNLSDEQGKNGMVRYEVGRSVLSKYLRPIYAFTFKHNFYCTIGVLHVSVPPKGHHQARNAIHRNTSMHLAMFSFICELANLHSRI